jgi:hypothetical protein
MKDLHFYLIQDFSRTKIDYRTLFSEMRYEKSLGILAVSQSVRLSAKILTINSSWYLDGWMNDLDFYVILMLNHMVSSDFFDRS